MLIFSSALSFLRVDLLDIFDDGFRIWFCWHLDYFLTEVYTDDNMTLTKGPGPESSAKLSPNEWAKVSNLF
jgi:hypothetical protein